MFHARLAIAFLLATTAACGSTSYVSTTDADACPPADAAYVPALPPARGDAGAVSGTTRWYAFDVIRLGVTKRGSNPPLYAIDAWKDYGFDLDGRNTLVCESKDSVNSCRRAPGSPTGVLTDGNGGIDNNFGSRVMLTIRSFDGHTEDNLNATIANGESTLLLRLADLGGDDDANVPGALYQTGHFATGAKPTFTEADRWPVLATSLVDGAAIDRPIVTFPRGHTVGGVWVSGEPDAKTTTIVLGHNFAELPIEHLVMTVGVHDGSDGILGGLMRAKTFEDANVVWAKNLGICPGSATFDQFVATIDEAVDLVADTPSFQDTTRPCDAISIGLGFSMKPTGAPSVVVPPPPATVSDVCGPPDAAADADGGDAAADATDAG